MVILRICTWAGILAFMVSLAAHAAPPSQPAAKSPASIFQQVFKGTTGQNGYEEIVAAAEALQSSRLWKQAEVGPSTLGFKRRVLLDRPVVRALALLKQGASKPVFSPRETHSISTALPELAPIRSLGRLLKLQQYVFLADGRTADAIQNARLCLRFGRAVQTDTLISGLVGIAISSVCIKSLGAHLDQFSAKDCELLYAVCMEWLAQPDPQVRLWESERRFGQTALVEVKVGVEKRGLSALREYTDLPAEELAEAEAFVKQAQSSPEMLEMIAAEASKRLDELHARWQAELKKPYWERQSTAVAFNLEDGRPSSWLVGLLLPAFNSVADRFAMEQAHVRILACHCSIRRYRWEHERLPESLAVLDLRELALDPFTGQPLRYQAKGTRYSLNSVGPIAAADDENAVDGRRPVFITPDG
jgi:hypothetical protein